MIQRLAFLGVTALTPFAVPPPPAAAAQDGLVLTAGTESSLPLAAASEAMKVYLPTNYDAGRKWPAIFYYHGMGEHPDTAVMRRFTGDRDYVVVAMPYPAATEQASMATDAATALRREQAGFRDARAWLSAHANVDTTRVFIAGASKGGWTASQLGEAERPGISGMIILLAGRPAPRGLPPPSVRGAPIYIGAGETDPNLFAARRAREVYKRAGAIVTFEEFTGRGHEIPGQAPLLAAWLQVQGRYRQNTVLDPPQQEATAELERLLTVAMAEPDPLAQYASWISLAEDPRLPFCDAALRQKMSTGFTALIQTSPAKEEWAAQLTFNECLYREACIEKLSDMKAVLEGFEALARNQPHTRCGKRAAEYLPRLTEAYDKSVEATRKANPTTPRAPQSAIAPSFPSSGANRDSIPIPVRRGNKITFEYPGGK